MFRYDEILVDAFSSINVDNELVQLFNQNTLCLDSLRFNRGKLSRRSSPCFGCVVCCSVKADRLSLLCVRDQ